jgi:DNA-binding NarL/FixJ family response regulator
MKVLIIDDHPITVLGLEHLFTTHFPDFEVTNAGNSKDARHYILNDSADLCILDITLPQTDTHSLLHFLLSKHPKCKVLMYSNSPDAIFALNFIKLGAKGFLNKNVPQSDVIAAIKAILAGQVYFSQNVLPAILQSMTGNSNKTAFEKLSPREMELFNHLIQGKSGKEICEILSIEPSTVTTIKSRLLKKLNAKSVVDLIRYFNNADLLDPNNNIE